MSSDRARPPAEFSSEAVETAEALGRNLLILEKCAADPDPEVLNSVFRQAHSLKGLAATFGQKRLAELAHAAEDLLDRFRLGKARVTPARLDLLLEAVELFQRLAEEPGSAVDEAQALAARLSSMDEGPERMGEDPLERLELAPQMRRVLTEFEEHRLRETLRRGELVWAARVEYPLETFDRELEQLKARLRGVGELVSTLPGPVGDRLDVLSFVLLVGSGAGEPGLRFAFGGVPVDLRPVPVRKERRAGAETEGAGRLEGAESGTVARTLRVDIARLDALMDDVGELRLIGEAIRGLSDARELSPRAWTAELLREHRRLVRRLDILQDRLLQARMVPLRLLFDRMQRLVRRMAREAGKEVVLETSGAEVQIDKRLVEELSDPLVHLVRNAIDHGIEPAGLREGRGKARAGRILLSAEQLGARVVLALTDDGGGVDWARVREVAIQRGLLDEERARAAGDRELQAVLFSPGFSTASAVSPMSGRGVGLDVVKTNIAGLSGVIDVESRPGEGTTFRVTLPVTLATVRGLLVGVSGRVYAVPLSSVLDVLAHDGEGTMENGRRVLSVRGRSISVVSLAETFGLPRRTEGGVYLVVVGVAERRLGLVVDALHGQRDLVTQALGPRLGQVPGISGAAEVGHHHTVLVLDVGALLDEVLRGPPLLVAEA
ncbi:MAG TPA: chemotaxis protein CheA [Myxococcaceae bacterium]|nr:chemotaxis protein CheA [Myxococcaceae bacterium]